MANTLHTRAIKWNHIGRRSNNGGLFPWAKREFRNRTNNMMRTRCIELQEWEDDILYEKQFKRDWLKQHQNFNNWMRFIQAMESF